MTTARAELSRAISRNAANSSFHMTAFTAFFFCGRFNVIVTIPSLRCTSMVSTNCDDTDGMGFNPHRKRVIRRADYVFVGAAIVAVVALLAWALFS
jgi:hypothetical protein